MFKLWLTTVLVGIALLGPPALAQSWIAAPGTRYHFGDDVRWADPGLDDSHWPIAPEGRWPTPAFDSDGMIWVRVHVQLPHGFGNSTSPLGPLALCLCEGLGEQRGARQIFVDGKLLGGYGGLPPHAESLVSPRQAVFPLRAKELERPGEAFVVAMRIWLPPAYRDGATSESRVVIDRLDVVTLRDRDARRTAAVAQSVEYGLSLLLLLLGLGILALWVATRRRELGLFALILLLGPLTIVFQDATSAGFLPIPTRVWILIYFPLMLVGSLMLLEFIWTSLALGGRYWKYLGFAASFFGCMAMVGFNWAHQGTSVVALCETLEDRLFDLRSVIEFIGALWGLFARKNRRLMAAVLVVFASTPFTEQLIRDQTIVLGGVVISIFSTGLLLWEFAVAGVLMRGGWRQWRASTELRVQFAAAREVQQRLVPMQLPSVPGYALEAAYLPANDVGGDFYQVLAQEDDSTLVIVGDVSGKGLKAAMTGALAIGAIRTLAAEGLRPAELLRRLNEQIGAAQDGGFITCICARLENDKLTIANAGHLSPYRNGEEVVVDSGFPLGIVAGAEYGETVATLAAGDRMTFLSDGVLEARAEDGALLGFERMAELSIQSAAEIAQAAQAFGQDDDITVLTLARVGGLEMGILGGARTPAVLLTAAFPISLNPLFTPMSMADRLHQSPDLILGALELSLSIAFLSLYWVARDFRVFRILSLFYVLLGLEQFMEYAGADPIDWTLRALAVGVIVEVAGQALSIRDRRWTRLFWPFYCLVFVGAWVPSLRGLRDLGAASEIPLGILIYQGFRRGGRVERLIAVALSLHLLVRITIFPTVSRLTGQSNFMVIGGWRVRLTALTLTTLGATTLIVFARVLMRDRAEKHRLATEFESAKAVQQVLVPEEIPAVAGFEIAAVYRPFGEVGGDFFQILPVAGGALVVIGDVSGKGLPAAMQVSLLVGYVCALADYLQSPAEILAAINRHMIGRSNGGFTTCLVMHVDRGGLMTIANAGHIAPYVDGCELEMENGLPLGLAMDMPYSESRVMLQSGQQVTLMTDGVVEARSAGGGLLGFERVAAMARKTAGEIADAAQAFGQDDDITVLTLVREG